MLPDLLVQCQCVGVLPDGLLDARLAQQQVDVCRVFASSLAHQLQGGQGLVHAETHLGTLMRQHQHVLAEQAGATDRHTTPACWADRLGRGLYWCKPVTRHAL